MKRFIFAMAMVLGLNMISAMINFSAPLSFAQESPEPAPEPKPESPKD